MLRIAVTGPPGAGKTTLLTRLAVWTEARSRRVTGLVAHAEGERGPGAARYVLEVLPEGTRTLLAEREGSGYHFHETGWIAARTWAERLAGGPRPHLLVLDELGRLEARGGGLAPLWPSVVAARPSLVVASVREDVLAEVEAQLGASFDRVVRADAPDAEETLQALCLEFDDWARVGLFGAGAGGIEATVGAALHGGIVPARGLLLSSTQAGVMTEAARGLGRRSRVVWVAFLSAGLKALSPAGSRLRPMLAIAMQGLLFGSGVGVLGWSVPGVFVAGALVGSWAALQGIALQWLLVGDELLRAYEAVAAFAEAHLGLGLPGLVVLLALMGAAYAAVTGTTALVVYRAGRLPARVQQALERGPGRIPAPPTPGRRAALRAGAADLVRPGFWVPIALVLLILALSGSPAERLAWTAMRALTVGFLLLAGVRLIAPQRLLDALRRRGVWGPAVALSEALARRAEPPRTT
ncbi:MAG: nucleoside-triphosphatase [Rubricoccaceae bacterium]